jgi:hypothetical protein
MLLGGIGIWWFGEAADATRRKRFENRDEISLEEFMAGCEAGPALDCELVQWLTNELAAAIGIRPGQLRPNDRIDTELAPERGWEFDDSVYAVIDSLVRRSGMRRVMKERRKSKRSVIWSK